jgi:hypothetical protein
MGYRLVLKKGLLAVISCLFWQKKIQERENYYDDGIIYRNIYIESVNCFIYDI